MTQFKLSPFLNLERIPGPLTLPHGIRASTLSRTNVTTTSSHVESGTRSCEEIGGERSFLTAFEKLPCRWNAASVIIPRCCI